MLSDILTNGEDRWTNLGIRKLDIIVCNAKSLIKHFAVQIWLIDEVKKSIACHIHFTPPFVILCPKVPYFLFQCRFFYWNGVDCCILGEMTEVM